MKYDYLGYGMGLRPEYYDDVLKKKPDVDWFELITENHLVPGGGPIYYLEKVRELYPIVLHGVSLSIGSTDPLNMEYLKQVKNLANKINPPWISDHLCWTGVDHKNLHDLMPLPYTEEAINHIVERVRIVQDFLGRRILLENVSSYMTYNESTMTEWEFLSAIAERSDCLILLDINNIFVSAQNHNFNPHDYLYNVPKDRVQQFHLAGHYYGEHCIIDTHDAPIIDGVWDLYADAVKHFGPVSTMVERDDNFPKFKEWLDELKKVKSIGESILSKEAIHE